MNAANEGDVEIREVKKSTKEYFAGLQAGADSKKKTYWCVSCCQLNGQYWSPFRRVLTLTLWLHVAVSCGLKLH